VRRLLAKQEFNAEKIPSTWFAAKAAPTAA
jgi:hypothetical protein